MVLIGMDVDNPESDFVGFSIEEQAPGSNAFVPLRNRLNFSYGNQTAAEAVDGFRNFPSTEAPFQKFRWKYTETDPAAGEPPRTRSPVPHRGCSRPEAFPFAMPSWLPPPRPKARYARPAFPC